MEKTGDPLIFVPSVFLTWRRAATASFDDQCVSSFSELFIIMQNKLS